MNNLKFKVYNNRKESFLTYKFNKTNNGWHMSHIAINGDCEPNGKPILYLNLNQDCIFYPNQIDILLEELWFDINEERINKITAQKRLQDIADWITLCEQNRPKVQSM
ncbi:hypothetical protein KKC15_09810 [bacterium]|nr:hypothetical protein [bacterium]